MERKRFAAAAAGDSGKGVIAPSHDIAVGGDDFPSFSPRMAVFTVFANPSASRVPDPS